MDLLGELKICSMAINSLKSNYLEHVLREKCIRKGFNNLIIGQYIAYASCHSILMDLIDKYEEENNKGIK